MTARLGVALAAAIACAWGCRDRAPAEPSREAGTGPGPSTTLPVTSPSDAGPGSPASGPDARAIGAGTKPEPVGGSWVTCYGQFRPAATPSRDVLRLGILCGPSNGMRQVGVTMEGDAEDVPAQHELAAKAGDCFRVFAVADTAVPELGVEVRSPSGALVAADYNNDRWPILNADGPFCVTQSGSHTVRVHARKGRGRYALQIWKLP